MMNVPVSQTTVPRTVRTHLEASHVLAILVTPSTQTDSIVMVNISDFYECLDLCIYKMTANCHCDIWLFFLSYIDLDECALGQDDCVQDCVNIDGGYNCTCFTGFTWNGTDCEQGLYVLVLRLLYAGEGFFLEF